MLELGQQRRRGRKAGELFAHSKIAKLCLRIPKLCQPNATVSQPVILHIKCELIIHEALDEPFFMTHLDGVPVAGTVRGHVHVLQNFPRENRLAIKPRQPEFAGGRVKPVMTLAAIRRKSQSGRAALVVQLHGHFQLVGQLGLGQFRKA